MDEESDPEQTEPMVDIHTVDEVFHSAAGHLNAQHGRLDRIRCGLDAGSHE